jgi:hypothetical protein
MSDFHLRKLIREFLESGDKEALHRIMAILRREGRAPNQQIPVLPIHKHSHNEVERLGGAFCFLCHQAIGAGSRMAEWADKYDVEIALQPSLELLIPEDSQHEMLRIFTSYPGIYSGAQILGLAIKVHDAPQDSNYIPRSAGIIYINFPFKDRTLPSVSFVYDAYRLITNHWMRRLAENIHQSQIISRANNTWSSFMEAAYDVSPENFERLALVAMRLIYSLDPPALVAPSTESIYDPEDQEIICQKILPCIEAGIKLQQWVQPNHYIQYLTSGWDNGIIPNSPHAQRFGVVGATPVAWDMRGGEIIDAPGGRYHSGGEAAVAYCGESGNRVGFITGPANELLPRNIRWSTAFTNRHDYDWPD